MNKSIESCKGISGAWRVGGATLLMAGLLGLVPSLALAVETDRITVEDPATSAIKFKVTSEGNVTATTYAGDGAALTNVPHWKGTWSGATAYTKDDCVFYGGSSWIALAASTNAQPNVTPASWVLFAQQGPAGAAGVAGAPGAQGIQGPVGPAGSSDTQADILTKLSTRVDGAALNVQQGPTEAGSTAKFTVKDSAGKIKSFITPDGRMSLGTNIFSSDSASRLYFVSSTLGGAVITMEAYGGAAGTVIGMRNANGTVTSPSASTTNNILAGITARGFDGTVFSSGSKASIFMNAAENWTSLGQGTYIDLATTANGTTTKATRIRIADSGNVGVGTTAPTQSLDVNGGVRLNTATARPTCTSSARGTFWVTQGAASADDSVAVCVQFGGGFTWKTLF